MRRPGGYAVLIDPDDGTREWDTFRCAHCGRHVHVPAKASPTEMGGYCARCAAPVCPRCHRHGRCVPFEFALERAEARARLRRSVDACR